MKRTAIVAGAVLCVLAPWLLRSATAGFDETSSEVRSERVSLGHGDYWMAATDGNTLTLVHEIGDRLLVRKVIPSPVSADSGDSAVEHAGIFAAGRISDVALARFGNRGGGLVAVVKVERGNKAEFWSLTLGDLERRVENEALSAQAALVLAGGSEDQILALSATRKGTIFTVVVGKMSDERPGAVEAGTILIDGCPFPTPSNGRAGHFRPLYEAEPYDN